MILPFYKCGVKYLSWKCQRCALNIKELFRELYVTFSSDNIISNERCRIEAHRELFRDLILSVRWSLKIRSAKNL